MNQSDIEYSQGKTNTRKEWIDNMIKLPAVGDIGKWIKFFDPTGIDIEHVNIVFPEILRNTDGKPIARMHHERLPFHNSI